MSNFNFETINTPSGAYISWDSKPGQVVTGKVLSYEPTGGTNFAGDPCPQLSLELVDDAYSVNKEGIRTDFQAGDLVVINCGLANLSRGVRAAALDPGDVVRITFDSTERTANGTVKIFAIAVARGAGRNTTSRPQPAQQQAPAAAPPF